eukprot:9920471-Heterocapsa_arctica.AAC.1
MRMPGLERGERAALARPGPRVQPLGAVPGEHPGAGEMRPAVEASNVGSPPLYSQVQLGMSPCVPGAGEMRPAVEASN